MKQVLVLFAMLPLLANAILPQEGKYKCSGMRAFTNTTVSTKDNLVLQYWLSKAGNPVVKIVTEDPAVATTPSIFGGEGSELLQPIKLDACTSRSHVTQISYCAQAELPPLNTNQNLFVTKGVQYVRSVKISGNFNPYDSVGNQYDNLAIEVSYRKTTSHWERIYGCKLVK